MPCRKNNKTSRNVTPWGFLYSPHLYMPASKVRKCNCRPLDKHDSHFADTFRFPFCQQHFTVYDLQFSWWLRFPDTWPASSCWQLPTSSHWLWFVTKNLMMVHTQCFEILMFFCPMMSCLLTVSIFHDFIQATQCKLKDGHCFFWEIEVCLSNWIVDENIYQSYKCCFFRSQNPWE